MTSLIIGSGKRVKSMILPALIMNNEKIYISGRNAEKIKKILDDFFLKPEQFIDLKLIKKNIEMFDRIIFSIPTKNYMELFNFIQLNTINKKISVFFETPFVSPLKNLSILKNKKINFYMLEDWTYKPIINLINYIEENDNDEKIKKIFFYKSGYFYHALALARKIFKANFNYSYLRKINNFKYYYFKFGKNNECAITDHRNYEDCFTIYEFKKLIILDSEYNLTNIIPKYKNKKVLLVKRKFNRNVISSISLVDENNNVLNSVNLNIDEKFYKYFETKNYENQEKLLTIVKIFNNSVKYEVNKNISDMFAFYFLNKFNFFHSFLINNYFIKLIIRLLR